MPLPDALTPRPSIFMMLYAGAVGMILLTSLIFLFPAFGLPFIDFPRLIGGIFTENPDVALWLGYWLFFLAGVFLFAPLLGQFWPSLPGRDIGFVGALVKGIIWGLTLWIFSGLALPVFGLLNRLPQVENPGLFAASAGLPGVIVVLGLHLAFGLATALLAAMPQGISPVDSLGWEGHGAASTREVVLEMEGRQVPGRA